MAMLRFNHTVTPDAEVVAILVTCANFVQLEDGRVQVHLDQGLESPLAARTEEILSQLGGRWDPYTHCMVLPKGVDPERLVDQLLDGGSIILRASVELSV